MLQFSSAGASAADTQSPAIVILGPETNDAEDIYRELDMLPIDSLHMLTTLRETDTSEPLYTFSVSDALLADVLKALAATLEQRISLPNSPEQPQSGTTRLMDYLANDIRVSAMINMADILAVLDQLAIASRCNIYLDNLTIIVDRCN